MCGSEDRDREGDQIDGGQPPLQRPAGDPLPVVELLELLADERQRAILEYLVHTPDDTVCLGDLADAMCDYRAARTGERPDRDLIETRLHHVHLPKLEDVGVLGYDARSGELRYSFEEKLKRWLTLLQREEQA